MNARENAPSMEGIAKHEFDGGCMCPQCRFEVANRARVRSTPTESLLDRIAALEDQLKEKS